MKSLWDLQDTIKRNNICIIGVPEREEREKVIKSLFKGIKPENFPNLERDFDIQVHEANRSTQSFNPRQSSPRHIIIKLFKMADRI